MLMIFFPEYFNKTLILLLTLILAGFIGFIDDRVKLRSRYKVLLTILTGSILYIAYLFSFITISSPIIPFLGKLRLTVLYPILSPLVIAIFSNIVNMLEGYNGEGSGTCLMLEGYNGEGSGTCLIALIFIFICGIIWQSTETIIYTIASIGVLIQVVLHCLAHWKQQYFVLSSFTFLMVFMFYILLRAFLRVRIFRRRKVT